jgi:hypothetical protein
MSVGRRTTLLAIGLASAFVTVAVVVALPPAAKSTPAGSAPLTVRGAYHIQSDRSDGSGTLDEIAAAASRAGLQFIIVTDHGDGTRVPEPPAYRHGVLVVDAVELSTTGGHYVALGLGATPYPFAGTPADVIEDVHRLGGFGIAAHPGSPRPALSWQDWNGEFDGLEWMNADSEWRDEPMSSLGFSLLTYMLRGPETLVSLLDRPENVLALWDAAGTQRRIVGLAGADAHARLGFRQRNDPDSSSIHLPLPSYDASFRAFSNHLELQRGLSGDATADTASVLDAIRAGRAYTVIDGIASPGGFTFTGVSGISRVTMGGELPLDQSPATVRANITAPPNTTMTLFRDGQSLRAVQTADLEVGVTGQPGIYRIEATIAGGPGHPPIPWLVSNPIYVGILHSVPTPAMTPNSDSALRVPVALDRVELEKGPGCASDADTGQGSGASEVNWRFALAPGNPTGQFAALRIPVSALSGFRAVRARVVADRPMRAWMQLRAPVGKVERWGSTFYADTDERVIELALDGFTPIGPLPGPHPPMDKVDSLLFVVDTLNTLPGKGGTLRVLSVELAR